MVRSEHGCQWSLLISIYNFYLCLHTAKYRKVDNLLTPWSRVLLEKLTGSAASQEIPCILGTQTFITVFTSARHLSLSWANFIQSRQPPPTSWRSILILSSHLRLGLPNGRSWQLTLLKISQQKRKPSMAKHGSEIGKLTMWVNWQCRYGGGNRGNYTEGS
jgi:hypothetical protein